MLRDLLVALSVVVLAQFFATTLPLVIPDPTIQALLGIALSFGIVAAVLRETEMLVWFTFVSGLLWLSDALLGLKDPVPAILVAGTILSAWKRWSSPRTPSRDATTLDSPAATPET